MSSARWKEPNAPEVPPSPVHVFRWTPGDGWCPPNLGPSLLQRLLCCTPAKQLLTLSFPKKSQDLHVTVVMNRCGARPQTAALQPTGSTKPRARFLYSTLPVWSESGLKVPVQVGERGVAATPRTYPLLLPGNHQFPEASFPLPPLPRRGSQAS